MVVVTDNDPMTTDNLTLGENSSSIGGDTYIEGTPSSRKRLSDFESPVVKKKLFDGEKSTLDVSCAPTTSHLPNPCPLPTTFTKKTNEACEKNQLLGTKKLAFLREASIYYYGLCPNPTSAEYITMAKTLCHKYPQLKDKISSEGQYWVSCLL